MTPTTPASPPTLSVSRVYPALSFSSPVGMLQAPSDASRWFVIEQAGSVRVFANVTAPTTASTFIDISSRVSSGGETGLLGMAFHPSFPGDPRVFLYYTAGSPLTVRISSFVTRDGGQTLDPTSEVVLLTIAKPESNHNGGQLVFGPEGFLYAGVGDGGGGGDQHGAIGNGQSTQTLLGKILRLNINSTSGSFAYGIPVGNPFAGSALCGAGGTGSSNCAEIYAWGLRNPWRFSFDRSGGALWIADVGQGSWEEVDRITAPANLGWRCREGAHDYNTNCGAATNLVEPVAEYGHSLGQSITGGFVYRGNAYANLRGRYVFGDFGSGRLWSIAADAGAGGTQTVSGGDASGLGISSFAEANDGELYVIDYGGGIYRLVSS